MPLSRSLAAVAAILLASALSAGAGPASAKTASDTRAAAANSKAAGESCVLNLETGAYRCYSSIEEMVVVETGGKITGVRSMRQYLKAETVEAIDAAQASTTINAIFYDGFDLTGPSLTMEASYGCDNSNDIDWSWRSLRSDWDNRINSGQGYSLCEFKVWDYVDYVGANYGWTGLTYGMGAMNNQTESVRMR